jgi:PAS domain S-box-containing protein
MEETSPGLEDGFFDLSIDMLVIAHFDGHFRRLNRAWERTLGFSREELQAAPMFTFVHPDDLERTLEQNRLVRSGEQALGFENRYRCKDGSYRWLLWNSTADPARRLIYAVARDVTARKAAEQERERLVRELQAALSEVTELRQVVPICMYCKSIRNDQDYWQTVEAYLSRHPQFSLSHGICPECHAKVHAEWTGDTKDT